MSYTLGLIFFTSVLKSEYFLMRVWIILGINEKRVLSRIPEFFSALSSPFTKNRIDFEEEPISVFEDV